MSPEERAVAEDAVQLLGSVEENEVVRDLALRLQLTEYFVFVEDCRWEAVLMSKTII